MKSPVLPEKPSNGWRPVKARDSVAAGAVYAAMLFSVSVVLTIASTMWLEPLFGAAAAFAIELTVMLPAAWLMIRLVAWSFEINAGWPMGVIVAGTTALLLPIADFAVLLLLGTVATQAIMNHGWMEARFVVQVLMAALPLVYPRPSPGTQQSS